MDIKEPDKKQQRHDRWKDLRYDSNKGVEYSRTDIKMVHHEEQNEGLEHLK